MGTACYVLIVHRVTALSIAERHNLQLAFKRRGRSLRLVCACVMCSLRTAQLPKRHATQAIPTCNFFYFVSTLVLPFKCTLYGRHSGASRHKKRWGGETESRWAWVLPLQESAGKSMNCVSWVPSLVGALPKFSKEPTSGWSSPKRRKTLAQRRSVTSQRSATPLEQYHISQIAVTGISETSKKIKP